MDLAERFRENIKKQFLFSSKDKLLLAVSGGVDSVVLCELCKQAGYNFIIAHCNFGLRIPESQRDESFVRNLSKKFNTEVFARAFDTKEYAAGNKLSIQEAARDIRYSYFNLLVNEGYANIILTAHHADDNTETLLMNFSRGTGLHGLTGIPMKIGIIRRPLLSFSKEELIAFAKENKLEYVEDSSNQSSKYTRNFFRNEVIPSISKVYPQVKENLKNNIERFKEIEALYRLSVEGLKKKLCRVKGNEIHIPVRQLMGYQNKALVYEIISGYGFQEKQVDELIKLAESDSGKYIQSPGNTWRILKHRHWFIISPVNSTETENFIIEEGQRKIIFPGGILQIETTPTINPKQQTINSVGCLDAKQVVFPLLLRKWKTGDYFYPLGMKKKKKINRFLIDQKLSATAKNNIWVIETGGRIAWIVGYRIDERFRVTDKTTGLVRLSLE